MVNFFNPQVVAIGGRLADCEPLLASMRATLYERCLPLATQTLLIERVAASQDIGITRRGPPGDRPRRSGRLISPQLAGLVT